MAMPRLAIALLAVTPAFAQDGTTEERKLATIPEDLALSNTFTGPDGVEYTSRTRFAFGAGGKFVAYAAFRGGKSVAMAGEEDLGEYHYLHQPVMDSTGSHYAFRAGNRTNPTKEKWWAIVDGKLGKSHAWISEVAVNPDGVAAFWVQPGAKIQKNGAYNQSSVEFHIGKRKGKKFDGLTPVDPVFSADGKTAIGVAMKGREYVAITATTRKQTVGKRGYPMIEGAALSPDGKRTALMISEGGPALPPGAPPPPGMTAGKMRIVVDGKHYGDETDGAGAPIFAAKGKRFAFKFVQGDKMGIALDNDKKFEGQYDFVGGMLFDQKGGTIVYTTNTGGKAPHYTKLRAWGMAKGGTWSLYTMNVRGKRKPKAIVEGVEGILHPTFGPDGQVAYAQQARGRWYMMVGDRRSEGFDDVGPPHWSADGKKVEFGARVDRELWWKVLELE